MNIERVRKWQLLQGRHFDEQYYRAMITSASSLPPTENYYFGCGQAYAQKRYDTSWLLSDIRQYPRTFLWDSLLGHPIKQARIVKSKQSLGMFTYNQVQFIFYETARILKKGGVFELGYRDFDLLLKRRPAMSHKMFNRLISGSGCYLGSHRYSIWTLPAVLEIANRVGFKLTDEKVYKASRNITLIRTNKPLPRTWGPEPKIEEDESGNFINRGCDFPTS